MKTVGLMLHAGTPRATPMRVPLDPPLSPDDVEIDLTEFAVEDDAPSVPRTFTPRIDEIELSALRAKARKP